MRHGSILAVFAGALVLAGVLDARAGIACSGGSSGWFVLSTPLGSDLMRLPGEAPPGTVRHATTLGATPALIAADESRVVLLYAASGEESAGERRWALRQVTVPMREGAPMPLPTPLPPLVARGTPIDLAATARELVVVVERTAVERELWRLEGAGWARSPWPNGLDPARRVRLIAAGGAIALWQDDADGRGGSLWHTASTPVALPALGPRARLVDCGAHLVALTPEPDRATRASLVMPAGLISFASIPAAEADQWLVPMPRGLAVIESDGRPLPRLTLRLISFSGTVLHDGPARTTSAVSGQALAMLAVLLLSLLASVLVFVFRPEGAARDAVTLPPNTALASPGLRVAAGAIDVALGLAAGWLIAVTFALDTDVAEGQSVRFGWGTLLTSLTCMVLLGSLAEWTWGRSLGKAMVGCRVVSMTGVSISWRQAFGRNIVRFLCPPLGLAWMMQPPGQSASLFGTLVIVELPPTDDKPPG